MLAQSSVKQKEEKFLKLCKAKVDECANIDVKKELIMQV